MMQEGIYDAFEKAVTKKVGEFKQGGGLDPSTTLGPLIGHSAVDRVRSKHMLTTPQRSSCRERALSRLAPCQSQLARCSAQTFNASTLTGHHPIMPSFAHESFVWSMFKSHMRLGMCRWQHMWRDAISKGAKVTIGGKKPDLPEPYNKVCCTAVLLCLAACRASSQ